LWLASDLAIDLSETGAEGTKSNAAQSQAPLTIELTSSLCRRAFNQKGSFTCIGVGYTRN